jgi:hypothetical protein
MDEALPPHGLGCPAELGGAKGGLPLARRVPQANLPDVMTTTRDDEGGPTLPVEDFDVPGPGWADGVAEFLQALPEEPRLEPEEGLAAA